MADGPPNETTPLVSQRKKDKGQTFLTKANVVFLRIVDYLNPVVTRRPWRLFEMCDQWLFPPFLRRCCQAMLAAEWTHRLPLIQRTSPANMAATLILGTLDEIQEVDGSKLTVVDFCSGGGGPVPVIEKLVNQKRAERNQPPIPFMLTDLKPHIDAWMAACAKSENLSFIPQPVDATDPPTAVISTTSANNDPSARYSSDSRTFRLYCLAFHHFPDPLARKVLASTLETADAFAILELQDRRFGSFVMMFLDFFLAFLATPFWFWHSPLQLFFTYIIPIIPFVLSFDGMVSALRTRSFGEIMALVDLSRSASSTSVEGTRARRELEETGVAERHGWAFRGGRQMHTWPIGYMNYVVGKRKMTAEQ